jgi:DNA-binding LacI/PurR family transcriptional regulator
MHVSLATIALGLAACGGEKAKGPDSAASAAGTAASNAPGKDKITIAMIAKSSTNPVFLASRTGAEAAAKELSEKDHIQVSVVWLTPPQEDGQVQAQRIQQAVNDGADAILISCSDAGKVTGAIDDAVARGVAVMTFDSDAPQSKRFAYYGVDDAKTGQQTMAELAKLMNGKGKVAILAGNQNAPGGCDHVAVPARLVCTVVACRRRRRAARGQRLRLRGAPDARLRIFQGAHRADLHDEATRQCTLHFLPRRWHADAADAAARRLRHLDRHAGALELRHHPCARRAR